MNRSAAAWRWSPVKTNSTDSIYAESPIRPDGAVHPLVDGIVSGGQTGADRAGLDAAMSLGIATGGWCPAGRRAEDGMIPDRYRLTETATREYATRTRRNVRESDGTLVLNLGALDGGTLATVAYAGKRCKPCRVVQLDDAACLSSQDIAEWLKLHDIRVLNVAGPRESKRPGIYLQGCDFLRRLLGGLVTG
jgi:hypothetical protein